jgi:hypothetical protein
MCQYGDCKHWRLLVKFEAPSKIINSYLNSNGEHICKDVKERSWIEHDTNTIVSPFVQPSLTFQFRTIKLSRVVMQILILSYHNGCII